MTKQTLITRSIYDGIWLDPLQCMHAYGVYTFPDGSEYRGYFQRGYFHGYGTLHLAAPYGFTFKGTFIDGQLDEIDSMWFDDGLYVKAAIDDFSMDFSSWKYCSKEDRRYADEHREGLQPIGPFSRLTPLQQPRLLGKNYYDVEEGIYNPSISLVTHRPKPFPSIEFIGCSKDIEWILKNCRQDSLSEKNFDAELCHKIMRNNLNCEKEIVQHKPSCNYDVDKNRKRYFAKLCPSQNSTVGESVEGFGNSEDSIGSRLRNSSSTCSSFQTTSLDVDVQEVLFLAHGYDVYNLDHRLSHDGSLMINNHAVRNN